MLRAARNFGSGVGRRRLMELATRGGAISYFLNADVAMAALRMRACRGRHDTKPPDNWRRCCRVLMQKIPMKDFAAEIRAHLDVEHFLSQAQLMLDWPVETNAEQILDRMLHHLLDSEESLTAYHDVSKVLFTHKSGRS